MQQASRGRLGSLAAYLCQHGSKFLDLFTDLALVRLPTVGSEGQTALGSLILEIKLEQNSSERFTLINPCFTWKKIK